MSDMSSQTYTEVIIQFNKRIDIVEQRILKRLDALVENGKSVEAMLARCEEKDIAMEAKLAKVDNLITSNTDRINKVGGLNAFIALLGSAIAGILGTQK